jgi:hypothetical protein
VSSAAITLCVASQRVFIVVSVYFVMIQSGNFWIHPRTWVFLVNNETSALKIGKFIHFTSRPDQLSKGYRRIKQPGSEADQ